MDSGSPDAGHGFRGVDGRLGYLLRQAQQAFRGAMDEALKGTGLTAPQYSVLSVFLFEDELSSAELARLAMVRPQSMHELVGTLEARGLVERRPHPTNRRIRLVRPTAGGRGTLTDASRRIAALEEQLVEGLSPRAERELREWLVRTAAAGPRWEPS